MAPKTLYIQMFSIHGLLRHQFMELGKDADTGGQIKYVIELGEALSRRDEVRRLDLFTRLVSDKTVSEDYAEPIESVNDKFRIIRIQCGGRKYLRKELLWPHLDEYVDKTIEFIRRHNQLPDFVHGHYPDAGYVCMQLASILGIPFVFTGHSLGRSKLKRLIKDGQKTATINKRYKIDYRINIEEEILKKADLVITSTNHEKISQYGQYDNKDLPKYSVIPPGFNVKNFYPFYHDNLPDTDKDENQMYAAASMMQELNRFFVHPDRPHILAISRPDKRKNIDRLIKAYGEDLELQAMANLAIFAGIRKDIAKMKDNEREVLAQILLQMDKYDLYGKIAIPKRHDFEFEVPELYRITAHSRGVFVNTALSEPFGITLMEAAATGLPVVAPMHGGAVDIVDSCKCGLLVDTSNTFEIATAIKKIISDSTAWESFSKSGILNTRKYYTWENHTDAYVENISQLTTTFKSPLSRMNFSKNAIRRSSEIRNYFLITDIDSTLIGENNDRLSELLKLVKGHQDSIGFGLATGRTIDSAIQYLEEHRVPLPDFLISSAGAEIYLTKDMHYCQDWEDHIAAKWNRRKIVEALNDLAFLSYQSEESQRPYKISYDFKLLGNHLPAVHKRLSRHKCRYNLVYSLDKHIDILPYRASKGKAVRYMSLIWDLPLKNLLVCGDSGNDEDMLTGESRAVVVGNCSPELIKLKTRKNIYFAQKKYAAGILEAINFYKFIEKAKKGVKKKNKGL